LRIALTAPTGKAAARLEQAVRKVMEALPCKEFVKEAVPDHASTIHRLLGSRSGSPFFRHGVENPLPLDVLVVDEASMVDLALMAKLVQALPKKSRFILLGDRDQLASVEAGAVLGDICDTGGSHDYSDHFIEHVRESTDCSLSRTGESTGLQDALVSLKKSYRFSPESGIAGTSMAVNKGDAGLVMDLLRSDGASDISWHEPKSPGLFSTDFRERFLSGFRDYLNETEPARAFSCFDRFRILCALRQGPWGAEAVNRAVEKILGDDAGLRTGRLWYPGRPVMITRNDYDLGLFNGDVGIALTDPESSANMRVFFPGEETGYRSFHPFRIPEHETAYALTVHKSQGSEFDNVLILLGDRDAPVLTRELLYTGITRARHHVEIWAPEPVLRQTVTRRIQRNSGLRDALWEG
jgi:exodeoxyribonuclease V alpha subunit